MFDVAYLRQFRIGPYAVFDFAVSYLGMYLLSPLLRNVFAKIHVNIPKSGWLWLTLPLAIVFHLVFKQRTPFMKTLFNQDHYYLEAITIVLMLYMGLRNIRTPIKG